MAVKIARAMALLVIVAMLTSPTDLSSCGPFLMSAVFSLSRQPDTPEAGFARGQLGILLPSFDRSYLIVAYRYLMGEGLSAEARRAIFSSAAKSGPPDRWDLEWAESIPPALDEWLAARKIIAGVSRPPKIDVFRRVSTPTSYEEYLNCPDDAFRTAAATLKARAAKYGAANADVHDWLRAQDEVFANCSGVAVIPQPAPIAGPSWLQLDRAYQIAAASFYAGSIEKAEPAFRKIAADVKSPWRIVSAYLVARCEVRLATIGEKPEAMVQAQSELDAILKDDGLKPVHPAASRLLNFVRARVDPGERLHTLATSLVAKNTPPSFSQDLTDYLFLFHRASDPADDLTDWLNTFREPVVKDLHAVERWRATRSATWLIAALSRAQGSDSSAAELLRAAAEVKADSPAYATTEFHTIRLLEESNRAEDARRRLDKMLATKMPPSTRNLFLAERMRVAESWEAFLKYAQRAPVGYGYDDQSESASTFAADKQLRAFAGGRQAFDVDSTILWNRSFPLSMLKKAAASPLLPATLRADIAMAASVRSVLLDGDSTTAEKRFTSIYLLLKNPGMRPFVEPGFGRLTPVARIDNFRDNWWCAVAPAQTDATYDYRRMRSQLKPPLTLLYGTDGPEAAFLTGADRAQASEEWSKLSALPSAPSYLAALVVEYVNAHPEDTRAAEALHLAVRATRYGCTDEETGQRSEAAYKLLHERYPKSEWAAKTKYWFR